MGNLQAFFTSTKGQLLIVLVILILFGIILFFGKNKKMDAKVLSISALLVALSTALSYVVLFKAPYGGSVTLFSILPIVLAGYFFNVRIGLIVGMAVGFLNLLLNPYIVHPIGVLWISILARYFCAFLSGVVFFGAYAPKGFNPVTWSLVYNASYLSVEGIMTTVLLFVPIIRHTLARLKESI